MQEDVAETVVTIFKNILVATELYFGRINCGKVLDCAIKYFFEQSFNFLN
jgi:hypothetical protein